jgi:hypothetical protein
MSYSSGTPAGFRHAGTYVAKILGATNPGDLPIEQTSKFIFRDQSEDRQRARHCRAPTLLALADEVIE